MPLDTESRYPFLHSGKLYDATKSSLMDEQRKCLVAMHEFNMTSPLELDKREKLLPQMFKSVGAGCFVEAPIHMNFGGNHISLGERVYINFNFCAVDDTFIEIGDCTLIGPNVTIATALHPENAELRDKGYQFNRPVKIGRSVWIGANVVICPGVTIGDHAVIGAGSVVTRDIPAGMLAFGNPCRVQRQVKNEAAPDVEVVSY